MIRTCYQRIRKKHYILSWLVVFYGKGVFVDVLGGRAGRATLNSFDSRMFLAKCMGPKYS